MQTSDVQTDGNIDSVKRAISDASSKMRPATALMLADLMAFVSSGRHFAETGQISKLIEYAAFMRVAH